MFVQTNSIKAIRSYLKDKLADLFSDNEIKLIGNEVICSRLKISKNDLIGLNDQLFSESDLLYFRSIVKRLLNNEPFQYIIGNTLFYGLEIKCDKRALIPRPETEELVDWIKESFVGNHQPKVIADICTGSGCIALGLKSIYPESLLVAADYSLESLSLARENSIELKLELEVMHFDATSEKDYMQLSVRENLKYDCWVSNPPYIPAQESQMMTDNVLEFEPHMALFVPDNDSLIFYKVISKMAHIYLKSKGLIFFEIHENFSKEVINILEDNNFVNIELRKDLQGKSRMLKAEKV